jgi:uncharacterized membrane protein
VAIAATLLVLPLTEHATEGGTPSLAEIVENSGAQILLFLLSFLVICRFWLAHHNIFRSLVTFDPRLFWVNVVWLVSIVLLPYTTGLIGTAESYDPATTGLYIGNMLLTCLAALGMQWHVRSTPELQEPDEQGSVRLAPGITTVVTLIVALVLAVTLPGVGAWSLLLLLFDGLVARLLGRRRASRHPKA